MIFCSKNVFIVSFLSYNIFCCLQNHWTWLTDALAHRCHVVNGKYPTAAAVSLVSLLPRLNTTSPLDVQGRCLPNAFPRVLVEALLICVVKTR